jgi:hypothetical protein
MSQAIRKPPPSELSTYILSQRVAGQYNPMDPHVECFGIEISIRNKDS